MSKTIALVLKSGGDFSIADVELLANQIHRKWKGEEKPRVICFYDKAHKAYNLGNFELHPLNTTLPGTWSRMVLYSPEVEQFKPFLYLDLDTALMQSAEKLFELVKEENHFIPLEDFYQKRQLATGVVWFPKNSEKTKRVWNTFKGSQGPRMDYFLRKVITPDCYWQDLTKDIHDFKPQRSIPLQSVPAGALLICLHGKPRMFEAANTIKWVRYYTRYIL